MQNVLVMIEGVYIQKLTNADSLFAGLFMVILCNFIVVYIILYEIYQLFIMLYDLCC